MESGIATITQAPVLREKAVNSFCGYWVSPDDATTDYTVWTYWCAAGTQCAIDKTVTPNIVFCPSPGFTPATAFYEYGSWPQSGCGYREVCCQDGFKTVNKQFDGSATTDNYCQDVVRTDLPSIIHVMTSFEGNSVQLLLWGDDPGTKPPAATVSNTAQSTARNTSPGPTQSTLTPTFSSLSSTDSSNQFTGGNLHPTTLSFPTKIASSPTLATSSALTPPSTLAPSSTSTPFSTSSTNPSQDKLSIGAEVGSIIAAVFGLVAIVVAIYYGHRQLKERKPNRGRSVPARPVRDSRV